MELRDRTRAQDAWTALWRDPASRLQCIRGAPDITQALRAHWSAFAATLGSGARVLDLGCGVGAAAGALLAARRDLRVTGIDFASVPPAAAGGTSMKLLADTPMEAMPFADSSFDAAISQFGYEYSRTHKTANRLARVLLPAARVSFIVHHAGSSVVATNRARLNAILAVQAMRDAFLAANAFVLDARLSSLRREHPGDALVIELSRILPLRARAAGRERTAAWSALETALSPELIILEAMDSCCVAPEELEGWLGPLRQLCVIASTSILRKPDGAPIAWCIDGARR